MNFFSSFNTFGQLGSNGPPITRSLDPNSPYFHQVRLLVRVIPFVARETCFALKGGTAINLFVRDLPRLSVDIDLAYLPSEEREIALKNIGEALDRIAKDLEKSADVRVIRQGKPEDCRLLVIDKSAQIKIEVNPVLRGTVWPVEEKPVSAKTEELFGFAEMQVLSFNDLYGGKICAALDRQHPRDFFDVKQLLDQDGIDRDLLKTSLVYIMCGKRPLAELLDPRPNKDFQLLYDDHFKGMTTFPVTVDQLQSSGRNLVSVIRKNMTKDDKEFLVSFKKGQPDWELLELDNIKDLPAVQRKLYNISQMSTEKHTLAVDRLIEVLDNKENGNATEG